MELRCLIRTFGLRLQSIEVQQIVDGFKKKCLGFVKLFETKQKKTKMPTQFQLRISLQQFTVETIREQGTTTQRSKAIT